MEFTELSKEIDNDPKLDKNQKNIIKFMLDAMLNEEPDILSILDKQISKEVLNNDNLK